MNRLAPDDEKYNGAERSTSSDNEEFDYEALEAAVMQTRRGRWFLREYLRRNQREDNRRLLQAVQRLADVSTRNMPAADHASSTSSMLESLRLLLADAANRLAALPTAASGAEPAHPDIAASRLALLLEGTSAQMATEAVTILREMFFRMAEVLDEPRPRAITPAEATLHDDPAEAAPAIQPEPAARPTTRDAQSPTPPAAPPSSGETVSRGKAGTKRIVIHRHPDSRQVHIPLPDREQADASKSKPEETRPGKRRAVVRLRNRKEKTG